MSAVLKLIGFGDDLPPGMSGNRQIVDTADSPSVAELLANIRLPIADDIIVFLDGQVVARSDWKTTRLCDNKEMIVLTAIEGG